MTRYKNIFILFSILTICSCDFIHKDNGRFGHSNTKEEAIANGSPVILYLPDKYSFRLLDGTTLLVDTAWTEASFSYRNGEKIINSGYGYHLSIPFIKKNPDSFTFTFCLADKSNEMFTNGLYDSLCQLCPTELYDEMKVLIEQKDPDTSKGWTHLIIRDTIVFKRL